MFRTAEPVLRTFAAASPVACPIAIHCGMPRTEAKATAAPKPAVPSQLPERQWFHSDPLVTFVAHHKRYFSDFCLSTCMPSLDRTATMIRIRKLLCLGIFSISTTLATSASSDMIVLMADEWCPYNCEPGSDSQGFMVEIAREAFMPFGHEIEYATLNWARALHRAALGEINGVIGALPDEAPEFIFGPAIGTYVDVIAFRRGEARRSILIAF